MQFTREIQRLSIAVLLIFTAISLTAIYWATIGTERILERDDNPRNVEQRANIQRGSLIDRQGNLLVSSSRSDDLVVRNYHYPAMNSVLGYFSLRYGEGGAEAAFNDILSGNDLNQDIGLYFKQSILHQPQQGSDVQLSLDLGVQQMLAASMENQQGAAVIIAIPSGDILALVSLPTYDPNQLDNNWSTLTQAPGNPFFNRAIQGNYQPGAISYTFLTTIALIEGFDINTVFEDASQPIMLDGVILQCTQSPPSTSLTLLQAYQYGCPGAFAQIVEQLQPEVVTEMIALFGLQNPPILSGFIPTLPDNLTPEPSPTSGLDSIENGDTTLQDALGQGSITVTPLQMAALLGAFINSGNAPTAHVLNAVRLPESTEWQAALPAQITMPITTQQTSQKMQTIMIEAVNQGNALPAYREGITIGGQTGLAYSGDKTHAWFIGFARTSARGGVTISVVLENSSDLELAASIAGDALEAAIRSIEP